MNNKHVTRTRLLIFPQFQLKLLAANLAVILAITGLIWFQLSRSFTDLSQAAGLSGAEAEFYRNYLEFHSQQLRMHLLLALATAAVASTVLTLMLSHRFSGPLVRLRGYFRALTEQPRNHPIPRLSFRRDDFLGDLPPLVNQALERIQQQAGDDRAGRKSA
jgi:signal transduction histidine kinase